MAQTAEDIWLTANGYDQIIDPFDPTGGSVSNRPGRLELADLPLLHLRLRLDDGSMLTSAERIIALQQWVVAQQNGKNLTIASAGPFSLVYWMDECAVAGRYPRTAQLSLCGLWGQWNLQTRELGEGRIPSHVHHRHEVPVGKRRAQSGF